MSNVFDADAPDAGKQALQHKGIVIGTILQRTPRSDPKYTPFLLESHLEVTHISDDGAIGVQGILINGVLDGKTKVVPMAMLTDYQIIKKENRLKELTRMPPILKDLDIFTRMVADIALHKIYQKNEKEGRINEHVIIQGSPKARLLARTSINANALTLVPWAYGVQVKPLLSKGANHAYVEVMTDPPKVYAISPPSGMGKTLELEFWRMQEEKKDAANANMKWDSTTVNVAWPVNMGCESKSVQVNVSVAINDKPIQANQSPFSPTNHGSHRQGRENLYEPGLVKRCGRMQDVCAPGSCEVLRRGRA